VHLVVSSAVIAANWEFRRKERSVNDWMGFIGVLELLLLCFAFLVLAAWKVWEIVQYNVPLPVGASLARYFRPCGVTSETSRRHPAKSYEVKAVVRRINAL
jgi:hypothetical protein